MKKPKPEWAPIIRARNSHLIHLGDRSVKHPEGGRFNGMVTVCGRELDYADSVFYSTSLEADEFLDERWKGHVYFDRRRRHKEPILCARCGTPEDFRDARLEYMEYHKQANAYLEYWKLRHNEIYNQLELSHNQDLKRLFHALSDNDCFAVTLNEIDRRSRLTITIEGHEYSLTPTESIRELTEELLKAEKETAEDD